MFPKFRGKQVLMRDENGLEKCVACGLCSVACPADAIYLEAAENDGTVEAGPRYASVYQIHKTRCIFCGYCEEACPVGAIFMGKDYELAVYSKDDFVWDKTDLLVPASDSPAPALADRGQRSGAQPPTSKPPFRSCRSARLATFTARSTRCRRSGAASGRADLGSGRRHRQQRRRVLHADPSDLLDQGQQRRLRRDRGSDGRPAAGADAALPAERRHVSRWGRGASPRWAGPSRRAGITRRWRRCRRRAAGGRPAPR